jgi:hypothetical protein
VYGVIKTPTKKTTTDKILGRFGFYLTRRESLGGSPSVLGSFTPYSQLNACGTREHYFIHEGYCHRSVPQYMDDTVYSWQEEVYGFAREIADKHHLKSVMDVGCGSAAKLLKYFGNDKTIGLDVEQTCSKLRKRYPNREWGIADFSAEIVPKADLVIASDVIEHLVDPDMLLKFILRASPQYAILSTPDRNLLRHGTFNGPPHNPAHLREWNMPELHTYLSQFLEIDEHFISYAAQATQCVLGRPRSASS